MLGLEGTESDDDRARAQAALRRLDAVIGRVWERRGTTHGFLAWDDRTLVGLAAALRRYPWDEIAACVAWSADEVADGRLKGAFFATTFRGSAFCRRHADWERAQARAQHEAIRSAERAAARAAQVDELAEASPEASGDGAPYEAWADMSEEALQRWRAEVRAELRPDDPQEATS